MLEWNRTIQNNSSMASVGDSVVSDGLICDYMQNINSGMIKPKYTQLISSCPAPLSSFPVSPHHPLFLSSTFSIRFLFLPLTSMPF